MDEITGARLRKHLADGGRVYARVRSDGGTILSEGLLDRNGSLPTKALPGWPVRATGIATKCEIVYEGKAWSAPLKASEAILWKSARVNLASIAPPTLQPIPGKLSLDDRFDEWLARKFGRAAWLRFGRRFVLEERFSTSDFYLLGALIVALQGPRAWAAIPIVAVWLGLRLWVGALDRRAKQREAEVPITISPWDLPEPGK